MASLTDTWKLGDLELENRLVLAPLAGIGNWFVRLQAKRFGAGLVTSEMVSSFGLAYGNERTVNELLRIPPDEPPVSIQRFGHDPAIMREAAAMAADAGADAIDLNMGCPVRKVCKTGAGAALLDDPAKAVALAEAARDGSRQSGRSLPITAKLRPGKTPGDRAGVQLAMRLADEAGVSAIALHPRHAPPQHGGPLPPPPRLPAARRPPRLRPGARAGRAVARARAPLRGPQRRRQGHDGVQRERRHRSDARPRIPWQPVALLAPAWPLQRRADRGGGRAGAPYDHRPG